MYVYYFLAALSAWFGIQSLLSGFRYAAYVRRETSLALPDFTPLVSIIAPSKGFEPGLSENIHALLHQDYPHYELIFVCEHQHDAALNVFKEAELDASSQAHTKTVVAGQSLDSGQKVHNLQIAVNYIDPKSEVLVFVDTDARPARNWLRQLVAPLNDERLGASTGYRWFVPLKGGLASRLRAVWNASVASALGEDEQKNFCWGGSTAIRRATFERLNIANRWQGSVSDDFTLTHVLKEAKLPIHFTPNCLLASPGDCDFNELLEFTTRQIKITRVYSPHLWVPLLFGGSLFTIVFFGGIILLLMRIYWRSNWHLLALTLFILFALGAAKAIIRWQAISIPLFAYRRELQRDLAAQIVLWPFASVLYLYNAIVAGFSRRIHWRGITYELKSPTEAVIIARDT